MEGAPHESRCYACLTAAPPQNLADDALPGLCAACRRATCCVRERMVRLFADRFGRGYFEQPQVDPPVLKARRACQSCGMVGSLFGWTRWRRRGGPDEAAVEGDAYEFCASCESLRVDPWRTGEPAAMPVAFASEGASAQMFTMNSSFLLVELIGLFVVLIVILLMLV